MPNQPLGFPFGFEQGVAGQVVGIHAADADNSLDPGAAAFFEEALCAFDVYVAQQPVPPAGFGSGQVDDGVGLGFFELLAQGEGVVDTAVVGRGRNAFSLEPGHEGTADEAGGTGDEYHECIVQAVT